MSETRRSGSPTIRDVARLTGVSAQTVSRVLNSSERVSPATRTLVQTAIAQLDYRRSPLARGLATNRSGAIGVIDTRSGVIGQMLLLSGVDKAARDAGYSPRVVLMQSDTESELRMAFETLRNEMVEGIIVMGNSTLHVRAAVLAAAQNNIVLVASDKQPGPGMSTIAVDQAGGARSLLLHLRQRGDSIGHIAGPVGWLDADARATTWSKITGPSTPELLRHGDWSAKSGYDAMHELLNTGVDSVFAGNDYMALGALHACSQRGVRVPDDVAVAGFDDIPGGDYFLPSLTTVRQPFAELGMRAVALLTELITRMEPRRELLPAELVIRQSA